MKALISEQKIVNVLFKKNYPDARLPKQAHSGDAGLDLYAYSGITLYPRELSCHYSETGRTLVDCGFSMALPEGWEAQIRPRSGNAAKQGLTVVNTPGTIDAGYRGPVRVALINLGTHPVVIEKGDRIAQMVISEVPFVDAEEVDELPDSERASGGFGSSGK